MSRARLTAHQSEVYARLVRLSGKRRRWVHDRSLGCPGALNSLWNKGYVEYQEVIGERGGRTHEWRPVEVTT